MKRVFLAAILAGMAMAGAAHAVTIQMYGTFANSALDFDGIFTIPNRLLPLGGLPAADGSVLPVKDTVVFVRSANKVDSWTDDIAFNHRYQAGPGGDRLLLDDGASTLTVNFGPDWDGSSVTGLTGTYFSGSRGTTLTIDGGLAYAQVPLPGALAGLALGLGAFGFIGRQRQRRLKTTGA